MDREPLPLTKARQLYAHVEQGHACTLDDVEEIRAQLSARMAHPSCGPELAERIAGMLLILDVIALSCADPELTAVV
jgi:hypothetical protein